MFGLLTFITLKKLIKWLIICTLVTVVIAFACNKWIELKTEKQIFSSIELLPNNKVGLLLGAKPGNLFYTNRIKAAIALFKARKINYIVVSGDNHTKEYDEGTAMFNDLMAGGIPDTCISIDYAGFRTLDSVVRCDKIFGQQSFTIISQKFHNERALFIANKKGLRCIAFNAEDVPSRFSKRTLIREYFARIKCILDIYIFKTQPKFLGDPILIP